MTALMVGGLLLSGCSHVYEIEFDLQSSPPGYADFSSTEIVIEEGLAVAVLLEPFEDGELMDEDAYLEASALNPGVLGLSTRDVGGRYEEIQERAFVFMARKQGLTTLDVYIHSDEDDDHFVTVEIPVTIIEQTQ